MAKSINRRKFLKMTSAAEMGIGVLGSSAGILKDASPNRKIRVAVMGTNNRGRGLAGGFARHPDAEVACICDVDVLDIKKSLKLYIMPGKPPRQKVLKTSDTHWMTGMLMLS